MADQQTLAPKEPAGQSLAWAVISTALLAVWLGWQAGWQWALAGVVGIFVHEYGHVLAINRAGCGPGRIRIIPFLGGVAEMRRAPHSEMAGALIALAGPTFGLLAAIPFYLLGALTGDQGWTGGALFIGIINIVNLAPAPPLDGSKVVGPVLARVHPLLERAALVVVGAVAVLWAIRSGNYIFGGFVTLGIVGALRRPALRARALRLTGRDTVAVLALYGAALFMCLAALQIAAEAMGADDALAVLGRLWS